jgi:hypothetical protein
MKTRLTDGWERKDVIQIAMVQQMIDDWISELEEEMGYEVQRYRFVR